VHRSLVDVDTTKIVVPNSMIARFGEETGEALDDPLAFELRIVNDRLPDILIEADEIEAFLQSQVLDNLQNDLGR